MLAFVVSVQPSSFEPAVSPELQIKWKSKTIQIALSTSLTLPSASITPDSDVLGAVQRALNSWSNAANITFVVSTSKVQSISPTGRGDGINLITIAPTVLPAATRLNTVPSESRGTKSTTRAVKLVNQASAAKTL